MDSTKSYNLWVAAFNGKQDKLKTILETQKNAIDINYKSGSFKGSPFIAAASKDHIAIMKVLLEYNCDPLARDKDGKTAVHHAILNRHSHVLQFLKENVVNFMDLLRIQCPMVELKMKCHWQPTMFRDISPLRLAILTCQTDTITQILEYESYEKNVLESAFNFAKSLSTLLTNEYGARVESIFKLLDNALKGEQPVGLAEDTGLNGGNIVKEDLSKPSLKQAEGAALLSNHGQVEEDSSILNLETCPKEITAESKEQNSEENTGSQISTLSTEASMTEIDATSETCREDKMLLSITEKLEVLNERVQNDSGSAQQKLGHLLEKIGRNTDGIDEMKQDIKAIIEIIKENQTQTKTETLDIKQQLIRVMGNISEKECNDDVYNRIFYIISKHVALKPQKWKKLYQVVSALHPEMKEKHKIEDTDQEFSDDYSKAYTCLVIWKMISGWKGKPQEIQVIMGKMGMDDLYESEIKPILVGTQRESGLSEKLLSDLAEKLGEEWKRLGLELGYKNSQLEHLEHDHRKAHDRNMQLLVKWYNKEGDRLNTPEILCKALIKIGRKDLAKHLK